MTVRVVPPVASRHTGLRRLWHLAGGLAVLAPFALGVLSREGYALSLAGAVGVLLAFDVVRLRSPVLNARFARWAGRLLLPRDVVGLNGTTYFLAGILLAVLLFPPRVAIAASLFLVLGDFAAGVVGQKWGRTRLRPGGKSLEGSAACLAVCLASAWPLVGWPAAAAGALVATVVEHAELPLDDNLLVPPVSAAVLFWLA